MGDWKPLWEGNHPLEQMRWGDLDLKEYILPYSLDIKRKEAWQDHLIIRPSDYDGKLIYLYSFQFHGNQLELNVGFIRFSTVMFMIENKLSIQEGIGMLGVQYIISHPKQPFILVGRRSPSQPYYPHAITLPGGMLEVYDMEKAPSIALMREASEEVNLPFESIPQLTAILSGWNNVSVTFLISTTLNENFPIDPSERLKGDDEWENGLFWLSKDQLTALKDDQLLDGLLYYKWKLT
jgi:8-oxo-dGTP pyrophosphatase MutT (NUDIX family)